MPGNKKAKKRPSTKTAPPPDQMSRRDLLKMGKYGALGVVALGGAGYFATGSFRAYAAEHDLSRLGQGNPVVVQVHDPQCPVCTQLQKQVRKALVSFDDCGLTYLVADIKTQDGAAFAARYGVPHVTLLLFDGNGQHRQTVSGMHSSDELDAVFAAHKAALA